MDPDADVLEQICFLARSETRVNVLAYLDQSGPTTRRELRTVLDASRSTITRTVTDLEERSIIERVEDTYRLTAVGNIVTAAFLDLIETFEMVDELSTFLEWFPVTAFDLDYHHLADADITVSTSSDPYAPARTQTELIHTADRHRSLLPAIDIEGMRVIHDRVGNGNLEAAAVVSPSVAETISAGEFATLCRDLSDTGQLRIYVVDEELPFYLGLIDDDTVQIGVEDDEGFPRALLETDNPSVREWGERVYTEYRQRARQQELGEL